MVLVPRAFLKELAPEKPDPDAHDGPCCSTFSDEGGLWLSDGCTCCNSSDAENAEQWRTAMNAVAKFDKLLAKHGLDRATIGANESRSESN
jgi:flagellin-like hook-associated protein FlgL